MDVTSLSKLTGHFPETALLLLTQEQIISSSWCQSMPPPQLDELVTTKMTIIFGIAGSSMHLPKGFSNASTFIVVNVSTGNRELLRKGVWDGVQRAIQLKSGRLVVAFGLNMPEKLPPMKFKFTGAEKDDSELEAYRIATSTVSVCGYYPAGSVQHCTKA